MYFEGVCMSPQRKGEIALLYLKHKFREEGIRLKPDMKRQMINTSKAIGISPGEALEFGEGLVRELMEEVFPSPKRP